MSQTEHTDVVVIGGGPAGTTAATFLQRQGHHCIVLEGARFPRYHVGESLIPHTYGTLERLGLLPKLRESQFPVKHSVRFVGRSGTASEPFYFSEFIEGERATTWQVSRGVFGQMCMENAQESGVDVRQSVRVKEVLFEGDQAVGVRAQARGEDAYEIRCKVVVDASGRQQIIGKQLDLTSPVEGLEKAGIWAYYKGGERLPAIDAGETTVFMIADRGWFWYIPQADDIVSIGVVADPSYLFAETRNYKDVFLREVAQCQPLQDRLAQATLHSAVRGIPHLAHCNRQIVGNGWAMVGDAAAFLDPIYSSGIFLAIASAELAADSIHEALAANDLSAASLGSFAEPLMAGVDVVHQLIHAFYTRGFSFKRFVERFPEQRQLLIDCLVGDVIEKDMSDFLVALQQMAPAAPALR
ncbi:MAG: flavin-dependent dehydrogenase [Rhodothermales bacterium]|jgi:flavin-dependent dehydrogenase